MDKSMSLPNGTGPSADLERQVDELDELVGAIVRGGSEATVANGTVQQLLVIAVKLYVLKRIQDPELTPFERDLVTATDVAITTTDMLRAVNLELFELGLWNSWGRR